VRTLLQSAAVFALLSLGVGTAVVVWDEHKLSAAVRIFAQDASQVAHHAETSLTALDETTINLRGVLTETQATATNLRLSSAAEADYWNATAKQTSLAARDMRQLIARTDRELNDHVLPDFDTELKATSTAAQFSMESLTHAGDALTFQLQDPEWGQTLHGFNVSAANLALASASGADILAHADHTAAYYDKKLTTPLGFWKTMLKELVPVAGAAGSVAAGFAKP